MCRRGRSLTRGRRKRTRLKDVGKERAIDLIVVGKDEALPEDVENKEARQEDVYKKVMS